MRKRLLIVSNMIRPANNRRRKSLLQDTSHSPIIGIHHTLPFLAVYSKAGNLFGEPGRKVRLIHRVYGECVGSGIG